MNSKMTTNSQLSTTEPKTKQNKTKQNKTKIPKQIARTGTESEKWRSHGGLSAGVGKGEKGRNGTGNK